MNSFSEMVEVLNLKFKYEELILNNKFSIPKKYKSLDNDSAAWCIEKIAVFNKKNKAVNEIKAVCFDYLERAANIKMAAIMVEYNMKENDDASSPQKQAS